MTSYRKPDSLWGALMLGLILSSCASGGKETAGGGPLVLSEAEIELLTRAQVDHGGNDIAMTAAIEDAAVRVEIENLSAKPLLIGPKNFALLAPSGGALIHAVNPDRGFPVARISPGERKIGYLRFQQAAPQSNKRLVFNHPDCKPTMTAIQ